MEHGHVRKECKHGKLHSQCRCMSRDKQIVIVPCDSRCEPKKQDYTIFPDHC